MSLLQSSFTHVHLGALQKHRMRIREVLGLHSGPAQHCQVGGGLSRTSLINRDECQHSWPQSWLHSCEHLTSNSQGKVMRAVENICNKAKQDKKTSIVFLRQQLQDSGWKPPTTRHFLTVNAELEGGSSWVLKVHSGSCRNSLSVVCVLCYETSLSFSGFVHLNQYINYLFGVECITE